MIAFLVQPSGDCLLLAFRKVRASRLLCAVAMLLFVQAAVVAQDVDFDKAVAPIFISHCLECHSGGNVQAGLNLSQVDLARQGGESGPAFAGDVAGSLIWQRVVANEMPPKHPLSDNDKAILKQWLAGGAKWGTSPIDPFSVTTDTRAGFDWWALQPLQNVLLPLVILIRRETKSMRCCM